MRIIIKSVLPLLIIFGFLTAQSQYATVRGTVYEKETGEPSFGTNVKIKFHTIDSFGSVNWWTGIDVQLNSGPIAMADLSYISGSSEHVAFIYNLMTATFLGEDLSDFYSE